TRRSADLTDFNMWHDNISYIIITSTATIICTYTSTLYIPISHLHYSLLLLLMFLLFILHIYFLLNISHLFTYSTLHMHILCTFTAFLHFWLDAKLHFVVLVLVFCAMTIKLNLISNKTALPLEK